VGQAIRGLPETPALKRPAASEPIGRWLARERRLRGLSLEEVAAVTRIPRRSLERLEAGAFDSQPDGFTRGFVRAVADAIGLDPTEAQARLLGEAAPQARRPIVLPGRWIAALALAALLGTLAAWIPSWWPEGPRALAGEAPPSPELRRRDFVRELAAQQPKQAERPAEPLD
jgi:transcriptional regulator with XRE-family HTH domain